MLRRPSSSTPFPYTTLFRSLLTGGAHLVVGPLDLEPDLLQDGADLVTQISHLVIGRGGEVAALQPGLVALVPAELGLVTVGVPHRLVGIDRVEAGVDRRLEAHVVEDVERGLGGDAGGDGGSGRPE